MRLSLEQKSNRIPCVVSMEFGSVSILSLNESTRSFLRIFIFKTVSLDYETQQTRYKNISNNEHCRLDRYVQTQNLLLRLLRY